MWKLGSDNALQSVDISLGITDHSYTAVTQVISGSLREGDTVVTGAVTAKTEPRARPAIGGAPRK